MDDIGKSESKPSVKIVQVDAKDLYLAGAIVEDECTGYNIKLPDGKFNLRRFSADMPYSLELIELRKIYEKVYRNRRFSFFDGWKEYSRHVVSVTYKYSVREYNRLKANTYVKDGWYYKDIELDDCVCVRDGVLIAVQVDTPFKKPIEESLLGKCFYIQDGKYKTKQNTKTLHNIGELREMTYLNGFWLDGIHFVRYKRSAGSARVGKCLFIDERLYKRIHEWELCGLSIKRGDAIDLAGFESYIALTLSSIIGQIEIQPENILLIDDYESVFKDKVVNVKEVDGKLEAVEEEVEVRNCINDGMSLIDPSLMEGYSQYGFILLRNRFFKSAAFNFNIQGFFKDHGIVSVDQLNGVTRAQRIEDVKLITTPSSIKYLKFGTFDMWLDNVGELFGVVKHEKKTHFFDGDLVKVHYQLLNSLQMSYDEAAEFLKPTMDYIDLLKTDPAVMRYHIKFGMDSEPEDEDEACRQFSAKSKNDIVFKMLGINNDFAKTKLYADFKKDVLKSFMKDARCGHILCNGTYAVLEGNPIEMALMACGQFNGESVLGAGNVYTPRFENGKQLLGSRSPHVAQGNVWLMRNKWDEQINKYCNLTNEIIVVNSIGENLLSRLSGADFDSDVSLITDNPHLIRAAQKNYDRFLVPTGSVISIKTKRHYTNADKCDLDRKTCENLIGQIVNLSQELNTKYWDGLNSGAAHEDVKQYYLDAALLDVLSNIEI